jgi:hypothetical protein
MLPESSTGGWVAMYSSILTLTLFTGNRENIFVCDTY